MEARSQGFLLPGWGWGAHSGAPHFNFQSELHGVDASLQFAPPSPELLTGLLLPTKRSLDGFPV